MTRVFSFCKITNEIGQKKGDGCFFLLRTYGLGQKLDKNLRMLYNIVRSRIENS